VRKTEPPESTFESACLRSIDWGSLTTVALCQRRGGAYKLRSRAGCDCHVVYVNGRFVEDEDAKISATDHSFL
jgi:hypothetical protein